MFDATEESPLPAAVVVEPKRQTIIYLFELAGWWYAGKRDVPLKHDVRSWHASGVGRLPDGYSGSGESRYDDVVAWKDVKKLHGIEGARWWITEVLIDADGATIEAAERDAIAGAREQFGDRCVNQAKGGGGPSPEVARRAAQKRSANPEYRAKIAEAIQRKYDEDPEYRANHAKGIQRRSEDPKWRAAIRANSGIAPLDGVITILATRNPHQPGGRGKHLAFSLYRDGMTVAEFFDAARPHGLMEPRNPDRKSSRALAGSFIRQDVKAGHIRIDAPATE